MKGVGAGMQFQTSTEELGRVMKMEYVIYGAQTLYIFEYLRNEERRISISSI